MSQFNNYYNPYPMGVAYQQPAPKPVMTDTLTPEERAMLRKNMNSFSLKVEPKDLVAAKCAHRDAQKGTFTTVPTTDPEDPNTQALLCTVCERTFSPDEAANPAYAKQAVKMFVNLIQTIKFLGIDLDRQVVEAISSMIPLAEKLPQLLEICNSKYNNYTNMQAPQDQFQQGANVLGMFNAISNPMYGAPQYNYGMQPQYANQYGVPAQPAYPQYNVQQQVTMGQDPFYVSAPPQAAQQVTNPVVMPQQTPVAAPAVQQPAQPVTNPAQVAAGQPATQTVVSQPIKL